MHTNSSSSLPHQSILNDGNTSSPLTLPRAPRAARNVEVTSPIRPEGIPHELEAYLTVTNKPYEIFTSLQDSRDRRLRLLLRRFTNQIQYGCKNPHCDTTSCLSYRKRHATSPFRPYNDVVARALAWRCVEQYAEASKDQNDNHSGILKRKGKAKSQHASNASGLCWNEPVVPWYEDPIQAARRVRMGGSRTTSELPNDRSAKVSQAHADSEESRPHGKLQQVAQFTSANGTVPKSGDIKMASTEIETSSHSVVENTSENKKNTIDQKDHDRIDNTTSRQRHVAFAEPLSWHSERQIRVKDTASFTQMLYDTASIETFDNTSIPEFTSQGLPPTNSIQIQSEPDRIETQDEDAAVTHVGGTATIPRVTTFRVLPLTAILWLRSTIPYDVHLSPHRDLNTIVNNGVYTDFTRQSLHFCLSNPLILLDSAKTWRFIHHQPYKLAENIRKSAIKSLARAEEDVLRSPKDVGLPQPGGIMVALGMLIVLTSIHEVLSHLFAALQHAYILPPWLMHMKKRDKSPFSKWQTTDDLLARQPDASKHHRKQARGSSSDNGQARPIFLDDAQIAQLFMLVMLALQLTVSLKPQSSTLSRPAPSKDFSDQYSRGRKSGVVFPTADLHKSWSGKSDATSYYQIYTGRLDMMNLWSFQRLLDSFVDVISHRLAITEIKKSNKCQTSKLEQSQNVIDFFMTEIFQALKIPDAVFHKQIMQLNLLDLLRSVMLRRWDRGPVIRKCGPVSGALELLAAVYRNRTDLGISPAEFEWNFIGDAFDEIDMPVEWLEFREDNTQTHILSYSFLFLPATLVKYFRAINSMMMKRSYDSACSVFADARQFLHTGSNMPLTVYGAKEVLSEIRPNMAKFFVLTISRQNMLQDAVNQIWRRQRQELTRPLKVRLGKDEGEDGLDHGGVQAEFFRLVFAEALNPDYGMFAIDERTRMTWFQPGSLEPLYKFEVLGILMSLAVYNGITLPITFPLAFYRKLLGLKVKTLQHIKDGWPDLTKGLQQLLDWSDGDVGQVIARTYEFSYDAFGASYTVDMTKIGKADPWPPIDRRRSKTASFDVSSAKDVLPSDGEIGDNPADDLTSTVPLNNANTSLSSAPLTPTTSSPKSKLGSTQLDDEAPLVTNANRDQYVKDYVHWLVTKSISTQFDSFATGFFTCIDRTALSIFTPEHLKTVIEGHQHIDIDGLQAIANYDEYKTTDDIIQWFWQVVRDMPPTRHKKLLEFVTASDRVPVNGIGSVVFIIQHNGEGDERLPSSSTCYGRLLLPRYTTKEVLREKLEKAIENSVGFGSL